MNDPFAGHVSPTPPPDTQPTPEPEPVATSETHAEPGPWSPDWRTAQRVGRPGIDAFDAVGPLEDRYEAVHGVDVVRAEAGQYLLRAEGSGSVWVVDDLDGFDVLPDGAPTPVSAASVDEAVAPGSVDWRHAQRVGRPGIDVFEAVGPLDEPYEAVHANGVIRADAGQYLLRAPGGDQVWVVHDLDAYQPVPQDA